jgi:GT2 family glycosyltransferase
MKLSIVIVNYNVKHFLEQCLKSVYAAISNMEAEIFVVDNNSVDGSVEMVANKFPQVNLIANQENVGFSKANNQAIEKSSGSYVLLLNPDTIVPEDCFDKVVSFADQQDSFGACGIHMVDGQGKFLPESKRGLPTPEVALYKMIGLNKVFPKSKKFGKYHLGYLPENETNEIEILSGAFMFIKKSVLKEVGLLDETFFMYGEDIDLSYRIIKAGYKNYYFADSSIIHYKGESTKRLSTNYVRVFYNAMIIFAKKHYSGRNQTLLTFFINIAIYARASLALATNFIRKFWLPIFETAIIFFVMFGLKEYWEEHIKFIKSYPKEMLTIHLPYYTVVWVSSLWFSGGYNSPFNFGKLFRGIGIGTLIIISIYGLLPNHLHFSRGIILFGTLVVTAALLAWRSIYHFIKFRTLDFSQRNYTKSILVGSMKKWNLVTDILKSYGKNYQQIGFVSNDKSSSENWLGNINQLEEIVKIYDINEVIFSADTVTAGETMKLMNSIGPSVSFFTIPANSDYVIGSQSKNANGLYFGESIELNLSKSEYRRQKRGFDVVSSLLLIVLIPILVFFPKARHLIGNIPKVLLGQKTWVGYSGNNLENLPTLKPGVLNTNYILKETSIQYQDNLNKLYAKNYAISNDLRALFSY